MSLVEEKKIEEVKRLNELIEEYPVIGILDMFKLPSKQLQEIRKKLRGKVIIKMTKKSLLRMAIKNSKKENIHELEKLIPQQPAIFFTKEDPFRIYLAIDKLKSPAQAKSGDVAPSDILVKAGPTSLLAGPVISELTKAGIPVGVEEGRIVVRKDVIVAKKGEIISKQLASALKKLGIEPMQVGLNIVAIYDGNVYSKEVLNLVNVYPEELKEAFNRALNLSVNICYPTKENIKYLLAKAYQNAKVIEKIGGVS